MKKYDVIILGGATSGAYMALKLAKKGFSVKIIEKLSEEKVGTKMDIFHVSRTDINTFDIPDVKEGSPEWAFEFTDNGFSSPSNRYKVSSTCETVGLHLHPYTLLMIKNAVEAGAEIEYNASFKEFIFSDGVISGVRYVSENEINEVYCRTIVDCSGASAVGRRNLPNGYGVERFELTDEDMFYVILRYVKFKEPSENTFWLNTKSWYAPFSMDNHEKIIGTGAVLSFDNAQRDADKLDCAVGLKDCEVIRTEKGITPYRRPPYSLVADNFIVTGDAACLTKPDCGEGVTSSMVMMDIAAECLSDALVKNDTSKEALWSINKKYNIVQGADFSMVRAFLTKLVCSVKDSELEYCFANGIIFNEVFLGGGKAGLKDIIQNIGGVISGLSGKNISKSTIASVFSGIKLGLELRMHYMNFPETIDGFDAWCKKSEKLWAKVGKVK